MFKCELLKYRFCGCSVEHNRSSLPRCAPQWLTFRKERKERFIWAELDLRLLVRCLPIQEELDHLLWLGEAPFLRGSWLKDSRLFDFCTLERRLLDQRPSLLRLSYPGSTKLDDLGSGLTSRALLFKLNFILIRRSRKEAAWVHLHLKKNRQACWAASLVSSTASIQPFACFPRLWTRPSWTMEFPLPVGGPLLLRTLVNRAWPVLESGRWFGMPTALLVSSSANRAWSLNNKTSYLWGRRFPARFPKARLEVGSSIAFFLNEKNKTVAHDLLASPPVPLLLISYWRNGSPIDRFRIEQWEKRSGWKGWSNRRRFFWLPNKKPLAHLRSNQCLVR